ncbi:MAG: hypothetical protein ACREX4_22485, partial [Gammaproteobacteria bacterium]
YMEALNPQTGWVWHPNARAWDALYQELAMGLGQLAIQDSFGSPRHNPRSVDEPRGPLPAELLDQWDEMDRQIDRMEQNEQIAADSRDSLQFQLQMSALDDSIAHFGEAIDDRAIIASSLKQKNHERRMQREQAAAAARARYAARMARLQANEARLQAQIKAGPKFHFGIDTDELHNDVIKDMYAQGIYVRVSDSVNIDGLKIERARGIYDTLYGRGNLDLDAEVQRYREFKKQDPSLVGLEIIAIEDMITPAEQARRLKLAEVQTFNQFSKAYAKTQRSSEGVEKAFLEYHFKRSKEINANWDRIDNAAGAVNLIAKGTMLGVGFVYDPVGTVGSLIVEFGTEKVLRAAGVNEQTAAMISGIAGVATGGAISYRQMAKAQPSVQDLVRAERAARAEYDAVRLTARAAEFEASKGAQIAEGVTLFKGIPSQARAAKAAYISPLLDAPSRSTPLALAGDLPRSGGVPPIPGPDIYGPAGHSLVYPVTGSQAGVAPMFRGADIGGFEYRSRLIANISDGGGGFTGGTIRAGTPAPTRHDIVPHGDQVSPRPAGYQSHHPESQTALRRALRPDQYRGADDVTIMLNQKDEHVGTFSPQARQRQNPNFISQLGTPEALGQAYVMLRNVGVSAEEAYEVIMKHAAYLFEASGRVK